MLRVAIIGRPNVGKSTLFNLFCRQMKAIESHIAGTTRDRIEETVLIGRKKIILTDTGGFEGIKMNGTIEKEMLVQIHQAIDEADLILYILSAEDGITPLDREVAKILRKKDKTVLLIANKADNKSRREEAMEFVRLGFGEATPVSAKNKQGFAEMEIVVRNQLSKLVQDKTLEKKSEESADLSVAIVGRPNVGKSSFLNSLLGKSRSIVSEIPGTTRDTVDTLLTIPNSKLNLEDSGKSSIKLLDTAGIRRPGRIEKGIEKFSLTRTRRAIYRSDVCVLILDPVEGVVNLDQSILSLALDEGKGIIIVVNKWDLVSDKSSCDWIDSSENLGAQFISYLQKKFGFVSYAPVVFISAHTKRNIWEVLAQAMQIKARREQKIKTSQLNTFLHKAMLDVLPKTAEKFLRPKFYYATQTDDSPPEFKLFVNYPKAFHFSYLRYIENRLREQWDFTGTPIKLKLMPRRPEKEK